MKASVPTLSKLQVKKTFILCYTIVTLKDLPLEVSVLIFIVGRHYITCWISNAMWGFDGGTHDAYLRRVDDTLPYFHASNTNTIKWHHCNWENTLWLYLLVLNFKSSSSEEGKNSWSLSIILPLIK